MSQTQIVEFSGEYRFLSNFYMRGFFSTHPVYGTTFARSAEHHFQAAKTTNLSAFMRVIRCATPAEAKRLARSLYYISSWEDVKIDVMRRVLQDKFQDPVLRKQLLATDNALLVEGNSWGDIFWGQCPLGNGQNWLGKLLMEARDGI